MPYLAGYVTPQDFGAVGNGTTDDTSAIQQAINYVGTSSGGGTLYIPPTASGYLLNSVPLTVTNTDTVIMGAGAEATILIIGSSFVGTAAVIISAYNCQVDNLSIHGNSGTTTSNPVCNGIEVSGVRRAKINRCTFNNVNGWMVEVAATNASSTSNCLGTQIAQCFGQSNAGGIRFLGNTTQAFAMNCQVSDIQMYGTGVTSGGSANLDGIRVEDAWDVELENVISWMSVGTGSSFHIKGNCAASFNTNMDLLGPTTGPCVLIENSTNGSPQNVQIMGGVIQQGAPGLSITGAAYQVHIATTRVINNQTHGIQVGGTGASIFLHDVFFNTNGAGATGTNYDLNWSGTSTGKVLECAMNSNIVAVSSPGVQNSVNITAAQAVLFDAITFGGTGASSANWFTATPAGVLESTGGNFNYLTTVTLGSGTRPAVAQPSAATNTAYAVNVNGSDANDRLRILGNGTYNIGPGTATRDTTFGRAASGVGYVTNSLLVGSATDLGDNGVGEIKLANATTTPTTNPTGGLLAYSSAGLLNTRSPSSLVQTVGGLVQSQTSTVTVSNTSTITALQSFTVPANDIAAGAVYELTGFGVFSTSGTPNLTFTMLWGGTGGTALVTSPAITMPNGLTNSPFFYECLINFRSTTSAWGVINLTIDTSTSTDIASTYIVTPTTATTITTTGSNALVLAVTWGNSSASNTISLNGGMVQRTA